MADLVPLIKKSSVFLAELVNLMKYTRHEGLRLPGRKLIGARRTRRLIVVLLFYSLGTWTLIQYRQLGDSEFSY